MANSFYLNMRIIRSLKSYATSRKILSICLQGIWMYDKMLLKSTNVFVSSNLSLFVYVNYGREENVTQDHWHT